MHFLLHPILQPVGESVRQQRTGCVCLFAQQCATTSRRLARNKEQTEYLLPLKVSSETENIALESVSVYIEPILVLLFVLSRAPPLPVWYGYMVVVVPNNI